MEGEIRSSFSILSRNNFGFFFFGNIRRSKFTDFYIAPFNFNRLNVIRKCNEFLHWSDLRCEFHDNPRRKLEKPITQNRHFVFSFAAKNTRNDKSGSLFFHRYASANCNFWMDGRLGGVEIKRGALLGERAADKRQNRVIERTENWIPSSLVPCPFHG